VRRTSRIAVALTASALTLTACGSEDPVEEDSGAGTTPSAESSEEESAEEEPEEPAADFQVGMAYDLGGRNDQSFNQAAATGMDMAADELGVETQESEAQPGEAESAREERLRTFADAGFNPIIAVGFAYSASVGKVALEYPEVTFAIVDDAVEGENVTNLLFAEEQGSFLVGAAAALKSEAGHIGFVGGVEVPLIQKFEAGYVAGATAVNPDIVVDITYLTQPPDFSGFGDPVKGRTAADGMYQAGADIVYQAAGGSGSGVFEGALAAGGLAIGVDSDQYNLVPDAQKPVIMTSMLKKVDVAVHEFITAFADRSVEAGPIIFDLESDGVGYATTGGAIDDIAGDLEDFKAQIIAGDITVPTTP